MIPSPGRIVEYTLNDLDADAVNRRRKDAAKHRASLTDPSGQTTHVETGVLYHVGNDVSAGDKYPLVITRVWGSTEGSSANGQVLLDGNDVLWVTSVAQGDDQRQWRAFPRV